MKILFLVGVLSFPLFAQPAGQAQLKPQISAIDYGCLGDPAKDSTDCLKKLWAASSRKSVLFPPGDYKCGGDPFQNAMLVDAAVVDAEGAVFLGCIFTSAGAKGGLTWTGGVFDTTSLTGRGGPPIWQVSQDHTSFIDTQFIFTKNYTAIQIGDTKNCPDDINIDGIRTTSGESHLTPVCVSNLRINNWMLDGTGHEDGIAIMGLAGPSRDIAISNVTATNTYDILKIVYSDYPISNISMTNWTCTNCVIPIYLEGDNKNGTPHPFTNIGVSHGTVIDLTGKSLLNLVYVSSTGVPMHNVTVTDVQAFGRFDNTTHEAGWIRFHEDGGAVFDHFVFSNLTLVTANVTAGSAPVGVVFGENDVPWTNFQFRNISANGSTGPCLSLYGLRFARRSDLEVSDSHFSDCAMSNHAQAAHYINNRVVWERNQTLLYPNQQELQSSSSKNPTGLGFQELSGPEYAGVASGTTVYCFDCAPTTPATLQAGNTGGTSCTKTPQAWACGSYDLAALHTYANNAAARAGGLKPGEMYRTDSGTLMIVF